MALQDELNLKFIGPVKTFTAGCPQEQVRHTLHGAERGTQVVFEEQDEDGGVDRRAVGWNDHWHKGLITNCGSARGCLTGLCAPHGA